MPWIRRATASVIAEETSDNNTVAEALTNNDGSERRIYGATLSLFASNDTLSSGAGMQAFWSSQSISNQLRQQGFDFRNADRDTNQRSADEARSGPFAVVQTSGRDNKEDSNETYVDLGHPDNYVPWPDGAQMHIGLVAEDAEDFGGRAHGVLYYQEGAGGL